MIFVDVLRPRGAPWPGGLAARLVSDVDEHDLRAFAQGIGLPMHWIRGMPYPHADLSVSWRRKALAAGAVPVAVGQRKFL